MRASSSTAKLAAASVKPWPFWRQARKLSVLRSQKRIGANLSKLHRRTQSHVWSGVECPRAFLKLVSPFAMPESGLFHATRFGHLHTASTSCLTIPSNNAAELISDGQWTLNPNHVCAEVELELRLVQIAHWGRRGVRRECLHLHPVERAIA